jgi:hypothetical protein
VGGGRGSEGTKEGRGLEAPALPHNPRFASEFSSNSLRYTDIHLHGVHTHTGWALAAAAWLTCWLLSTVFVGLKSMEAPLSSISMSQNKARPSSEKVRDSLQEESTKGN